MPKSNTLICSRLRCRLFEPLGPRGPRNSLAILSTSGGVKGLDDPCTRLQNILIEGRSVVGIGDCVPSIPASAGRKDFRPEGPDERPLGQVHKVP